MIKLGILGGSFNPVHKGHIELANYLVDKKIVDEVVMIPSVKNPLKGMEDYVDTLHRYLMLKEGINEIGRKPNVYASPIEMQQFSGRDSVYAVELLKHIVYKNVDEYDNIEFYYIIGADTFNKLHLFKDYEWITESGIIKTIVMMRPGSNLSNENVNTDNCIFVHDCPQIDISSTVVRSLIKEGKLHIAAEYVPDSVLHYITQKHLYGF